VFGAGGLGHLAVQYARITGASVVAVDTNPARLESARVVGAEHVVNPLEEDPVAAIQKLGGADAAIATAVSPEPFAQAFRSLARGGRMVCVGLPADNHLEIPIFETVLGGLDLRGSIVGTRHDLEEVFELHRRGLTELEYVERPLDDVNTAIEQVLDGSAPAPRLVFRMAEATAGERESSAVTAA
jgi:propanol-preferring alcohol dehydrogenase